MPLHPDAAPLAFAPGEMEILAHSLPQLQQLAHSDETLGVFYLAPQAVLGALVHEPSAAPTVWDALRQRATSESLPQALSGLLWQREVGILRDDELPEEARRIVAIRNRSTTILELLEDAEPEGLTHLPGTEEPCRRLRDLAYQNIATPIPTDLIIAAA